MTKLRSLSGPILLEKHVKFEWTFSGALYDKWQFKKRAVPLGLKELNTLKFNSGLWILKRIIMITWSGKEACIKSMSLNKEVSDDI
jgi:hypothetical protein